MPRSVPDDDMMEDQQSLDLGHATRALDALAVRRRSTLIPTNREIDTREALERAAYMPKHWRWGRPGGAGRT